MIHPKVESEPDCRRRILEVMLSKGKGITEEELNGRIKDFRYDTIQAGIRTLLAKGVIAVSNRRFWIRNMLECMRIKNGQADD